MKKNIFTFFVLFFYIFQIGSVSAQNLDYSKVINEFEKRINKISDISRLEGIEKRINNKINDVSNSTLQLLLRSFEYMTQKRIETIVVKDSSNIIDTYIDIGGIIDNNNNSNNNSSDNTNNSNTNNSSNNNSSDSTNNSNTNNSSNNNSSDNTNNSNTNNSSNNNSSDNTNNSNTNNSSNNSGDQSDVIFKTSFENDNWMKLLYRGNSGSLGFKYQGYNEHTWKETNKDNIKNGNASLGWINTKGSNVVWGYAFNSFREDQALYLRYFRKYEKDFEFKTEAKGHALFAKKDYLDVGAGVRPTGYNGYDCRVQIMPDTWYDNGSRKSIHWGDVHKGEPTLYCYHLDQITNYGDKFRQNIGTPILIETGKWYMYEMMLKPNNAGNKDGEAKLWINGELKIHQTGLEFRKTNDLKINVLELSARAGGGSPAPKTQKLYDDDIVFSKNYIGNRFLGDIGDIGKDISPKDILNNTSSNNSNTIVNNETSQNNTTNESINNNNNNNNNNQVIVKDNICTTPDIQIGRQIWQSCNVGATKTFSGDNYTIRIKNETQFKNQENTLGKVYDYSIVQNNVCPTGYRIPTRSDWNYAVNETSKTVTQYGNDTLIGRVAQILKLPVVPYTEKGVLKFDKIGVYQTNESANDKTNYVFEYTNAYRSGINENFSMYPKDFGFAVRCIKE